MEPVTEILPANTGVLVKANAGTYTFAYSEESAVDMAANLFMGEVNTYNIYNSVFLGGL